MKELSTEEKAKRYDEAIEKAKAWCDCEHATTNDKILLKRIFPELAESEDERIRKELLNAFQESEDSLYMVLTPHKRESFIAWLEKQGEQKPNPCDGCINRKGCINCENGELRETEHKPTNKVEPKFKVGDRIKRIGIGYESWVITDIDEMFNEYQGKYEKGYPTSLSFIEQDNYELVGLKSAWSVEDESILFCTISDLKFLRDIISKDPKYAVNIIDIEREINWLKSLKDRVQPKQDWSEDDERYLNNTISYLKDATEFKETAKLCIDWLKSLRPQNRWKPSKGQLECLGYAIEKAEKDWSPLTNNRIYLTLKALKEQLLELKGSKV